MIRSASSPYRATRPGAGCARRCAKIFCSPSPGRSAQSQRTPGRSAKRAYTAADSRSMKGSPAVMRVSGQSPLACAAPCFSKSPRLRRRTCCCTLGNGAAPSKATSTSRAGAMRSTRSSASSVAATSAASSAGQSRASPGRSSSSARWQSYTSEFESRHSRSGGAAPNADTPSSSPGQLRIR